MPRPRKKVTLPIGVHSIGFPRGTSDFLIVSWLLDHDFGAPIKIIPPKTGKYVWARLRNVSPLYRYRTEHWNTSLGTVAVRFAVHKRRAPKKAARSRRRRGAANEERCAGGARPAWRLRP